MKKTHLHLFIYLMAVLSVVTAFHYTRLFFPLLNGADSNASQKETDVTQTQLAVANASTEGEKASSDPENEVTVDAVQIGSEDVSLYSQPDSNSSEVTTVTRGEYVEYLDTTNGWYHVIVNNEYEGYVSSLYSERCTYEEAVSPSSLKDTVVVLNPGHGGDDTGALSNDEYFYEKDVTLDTALVIQETLEAAGCTVILTRDSDTTESLDDIVADSIDNQADFFISLHYDSTEYMNEASGTTTYYYYKKYAELAETVNEVLYATLPLENRGVEVGNFQVLRENTRPALLLELGYMNNDDDFQTFITQSYQQQVADALLDGLTAYVEHN